MASAQQTFKAMMRGGIRPGLRALGLQGTGPTFAWPCRGNIALLGFQASRHSDAAQVQFTINLSLRSETAWAKARRTHSWLPEKPPANARTSVGWEVRIGALLPDGKDRWWTLHADEDWSAMTKEIVSAVETYVIPEFRVQAISSARRRIALRSRPSTR